MAGKIATGLVQEGVLSLSVAGSVNVTLTQSQWENGVQIYTGALTGNISVFVSLTAGMRWSVFNNTSGAFTLTVIGASGTGVAVTQGKRIVLWTDGTNVYAATTDTAGSGFAASGANTDITSLAGVRVAESNVIGGMPVIHMIPVPAGATGNVDITLTYKTRVLDMWLVKKSAAGGGAGTIQLFNGATAISDALSIDIADKVLVRAGTIDDASYEVAAAGTLRVTRTRTASTDETCLVVVEGVLVA